MQHLKTLREGWDEIEREERRSGESLTLERSVKIFLSLYECMEAQMKETEEMFRSEREAYLTELQLRLRRFDTWHRQQNGNTI